MNNMNPLNLSSLNSEVINFFDMHAENWENYITPETLLRAESLLDKVSIKPGYTILDIGCGTGVLVQYLMKRLQDRGILIEMDISSKMLRVGMVKFHNEYLHWVTADGHFLPIKDKSTDVVICYAVFPHFIDKEKAIRDISRVLKPGGQMAICHSKSSTEINNIHKNIGGVVENHTIPEVSKIQEWCNSSGMQITHFQDGEDGYLLIAEKG